MPSWTVEGDLSPVTLRGDYLRKITGIEDKNYDEPGFLNLLFAGIIAEQFGARADSSKFILGNNVELTDDLYNIMKDTGFPIQSVYYDTLIGIYWPNLLSGLCDFSYEYNDDRIYFGLAPNCAYAIATNILRRHPEYAETYDFVMPHFAEIARRKRKEYNCPPMPTS